MTKPSTSVAAAKADLDGLIPTWRLLDDVQGLQEQKAELEAAIAAGESSAGRGRGRGRGQIRGPARKESRGASEFANAARRQARRYRRARTLRFKTSSEGSAMSFDEYPDAFIWECDTCHLQAQFPPTSFWHGHGELKARGLAFSPATRRELGPMRAASAKPRLTRDCWTGHRTSCHA